MPRRINNCLKCDCRFIAKSRKERNCENCSKEQQPFHESSTPSSPKRGLDQTFTAENVKSAAFVETFSKSDDDVCSEASDDLQCTQIVDLVDDSSESDASEKVSVDKPCLIKANENARPKPEDCKSDMNQLKQSRDSSTLRPEPKNQNSNSCFICGASLDHLKTGRQGRINHIKRCSKKHGVTARDMRLDDDQEVFEMNQRINDTPERRAGKKIVNPYEKRKSSNTDKTTRAVMNDSSASTSLGESGVSQRSAFGVLMAGAKRVAKTAQLKTENQEKQYKRGRSSWGRDRDYSQLPCPQYKKITGTDFVCDGFHYAKKSLTENYFLTHFHADHWGGITKSWDTGVIYCSAVTANLVTEQLGVDRKFLHPLPMLTPTVIGSRGKPVTVTLLDANHCPGAVMFLFEVGGRSVLHVGDFRWNRQVMEAQYPLKPFFRGSKLAQLYLDTTYCDPKYNLPLQSDAIRETIAVAKEHVAKARARHEKLLLLFGAYTIGKERIYLSVAEELGMKVYVDSRRYRVLSALEWPPEKMALLTTRKDESRLVSAALFWPNLAVDMTNPLS